MSFKNYGTRQRILCRAGLPSTRQRNNARHTSRRAHGKERCTAKRTESARQISTPRQRPFAVRRSIHHGKDVDQNLPRIPNISRENISSRAPRSRALKKSREQLCRVPALRRTAQPFFAVSHARGITADNLFAVWPRPKRTANHVFPPLLSLSLFP